MKYATDYGILLELFMNTMTTADKELAHKAFIRKIYNKIYRFHKRRANMCVTSERRVRRAVTKAEAELKDLPSEISLGAICWLIHNRHREELAPYNFDPVTFEQMNKFFTGQGVIMQTAKVLNKIEEHMYDS